MAANSMPGALTDQPRLNLGPLTTTWTPPASCSTPTWLCIENDCRNVWQGQMCVSGGIQDDYRCWPLTSEGAKFPLSYPPLLGWGFYSPGVVCPAGYTSACSATVGDDDLGSTTGFAFQFALTRGETAIGCCQSGYTCSQHPYYGQTCKLHGDGLSTSTTLPYSVCENGSVRSVGRFTLPNQDISAIQNVFAPMFQLNHRWTADIVKTTKETTTETPAPRPTINASIPLDTTTSKWGPTVETRNPSDGSDPSSEGLSIGAVAGIAVGAVILAFGVLGGVLYTWRRKRRRNSPSMPVTPLQEEMYSHKATHMGIAELNDQLYVHEAPAPDNSPRELP